MRLKLLPVAAVTAVVALSGAACASTTTDASSGSTGGSSEAAQVAGVDEVDASTICGDKPTVVALTDGYGGDTWRKTVLAELQDEASKCPNVTEVRYANANGDQQKAIADINGLTTQGVNVMLTFPDFGASMLPALRSATQAGVSTVDYFVDLGGAEGTDYTAKVVQDSYQSGVDWANWYGEHLKTGNVLMLGGPAGAQSSAKFLAGFKEGLTQYPDLNLLSDDYIVTNWSAVDAQKAVAGLLAKYPQIDGIASDYGVSTSAAVKAFQQVGRPLPMFTNSASNNELNCLWEGLNANGQAFPFASSEHTTSLVRNAFRRGMAEYQGVTLDEPSVVQVPLGIDTFAGENPPCNPSYPPDADMFSQLTPEQLQEVFGQ